MTDENSWVVFWTEYTADTYTYGSKITFHNREDTEFENRLMPPGTVIKRWRSATNYQAQRIEPTLPIIDGERRYQLVVNMECDPGENYLFRLVFFDRYNKEAGFVNITDHITEFQCPLKTYSYELQLINSGMTHFHFYTAIISDITETDEPKKSEKTIRKIKKGKKTRRKNKQAD